MLQAHSPGSVGDEAGSKVRLRRSRFLGATVTIAAVLAALLIIISLELLAYLLEGKVALGRSRVEAAAAVARGADQRPATFESSPRAMPSAASRVGRRGTMTV